MTQNQNSRDRSFISRDEFEVFERNVDTSFARLTDAVTSLTDKIDSKTATNWGVLTGFGTLLLAVVALAGAPFMRDLGRLEVNRQSLESEFRAHTMTDGHSPMIQRMAGTEKSMDLYILPEIQSILDKIAAIQQDLARRGAVMDQLKRDIAQISAEQRRQADKVYAPTDKQ